MHYEDETDGFGEDHDLDGPGCGHAGQVVPRYGGKGRQGQLPDGRLGAFGNVWEKKVAIVFIRPQRYTKQFMDASGRFTMTFFDGYRKELLYLGSHSGKDVPDKIEKTGLHLTHVDGQPTYEEGRYLLVCKILYSQAEKPELFLDAEVPGAVFPDKDYSVMYVGEIEAAYELEP